MKAVWIVLWGPTMVAWFLFEALVSLCAQFHHSNTDFPNGVERWLSCGLVTPRFHAAHHAVDQHYGNANFATISSIWNRLFGSYARPADDGATTRAVERAAVCPRLGNSRSRRSPGSMSHCAVAIWISTEGATRKVDARRCCSD